MVLASLIAARLRSPPFASRGIATSQRLTEAETHANSIAASRHQEAVEDIDEQLDVPAPKEPLHGGQLDSVRPGVFLGGLHEAEQYGARSATPLRRHYPKRRRREGFSTPQIEDGQVHPRAPR